MQLFHDGHQCPCIPIAVKLLLLVSCILVVSSDALGEDLPQPSVKWTYQCASPVYSSPVVADLVADHPGDEILVLSSSERKVLCLSAAGEILWTWGPFSLRVTATPTLADLNHDSHPEILLATRTDGVVCLSPAGQEVWRQPAQGGIPWGNVSVADLNHDGNYEILWATETGWIECIGADCKPLWSFHTDQGVTLGPLSVGDLDGDGTDEVIAQGGPVVYAINREGKELWHFEGGARFNAGPVMANLVGDKKPEVLAASNDGVVYCLDGMSGKPLWTHRTFPGRIDTTLAVGDIDAVPGVEVFYADGGGNLYCLSQAGSECWHYKAADWIESAPVLGDVDGDHSIEVIAGSGEGVVHCLSSGGDLKWSFNTGKRVSASPTLCDCDRDEKLEILVASHNGTLYCLSMAGAWDPDRVPWPAKRLNLMQTACMPIESQEAGVEVTSSEQATDIIPGKEGVIASDSASIVGLQRIGSGSLIANSTFKDLEVVSSPDHLSSPWPRSWRRYYHYGDRENQADGSVSIGTDDSGSHLIVKKGPGAFVLSAEPVPMPAETLYLSGWVEVGTGENQSPTFILSQVGAKGEILRNQSGVATRKDGNEVSSTGNVRAVSDTERLCCFLRFPEAAGEYTVRHVHLEALSKPDTRVEILLDQAGYESQQPIRFMVASGISPATGPAEFALVRGDGSQFNGALTPLGRVVGQDGSDWGKYYFEGSMNGITSGTYTLTVRLGGETAESSGIRIEPQDLLHQTGELAYRFYSVQRCGCEVPGWHGPCHMDDARLPDGTHVDATGGYHNAGDYHKHMGDNTPVSVYGMVRAYVENRPFFDGIDQDKNGQADLLDEVLWGAAWIRKMIDPSTGRFWMNVTNDIDYFGIPERDTDGIPGTADDRIVGVSCPVDMGAYAIAALAVLSCMGENPEYLQVAERVWRAYELQIRTCNDPRVLIAGLELFRATHKEIYRQTCERVAAGILTLQSPEGWFSSSPGGGPVFRIVDEGVIPAALAEFVLAWPDSDLSAEVREGLRHYYNHIFHMTDNPFGILRHYSDVEPFYFKKREEWFGGSNSSYCSLAWAASLAQHVFVEDPSYQRQLQRLADNQIHWILGMNPLGLCMFEGVGNSERMRFHHNYAEIPGHSRGAVPGAIPNGIIRDRANSDCPWFDLRTGTGSLPCAEAAEPWLPHNAYYLLALSTLSQQRIKSFCIDFNWGPEGFAPPGMYTQASPAEHLEWYKQMGVNTIQTFCVSCPGYAWYHSDIAPVQPGIKGEFLNEITGLGHRAGMKVMGYFCIGANSFWSQQHPDLCHPLPNAIAIPFTTAYLDYLQGVIPEALNRTGIDGFMIDWVYNASHLYPNTEYRWLDCEKQMYSELFGEPFPGEDAMDAGRITEFNRRATDRCWQTIKNAAKGAKPDCIIWLTAYDLTHPMITDSAMLRQVDWLMNEHPDPARLEAVRQSVGPHTQIIQCVCGWGDQHNAAKILQDPHFAQVGIYGFAKPDLNTTLPPEDGSGNARNIAAMREAFQSP